MKCWSVKCLISSCSPHEKQLCITCIFLWNGSINLFFFYSQPLTFFTFYKLLDSREFVQRSALPRLSVRRMSGSFLSYSRLFLCWVIILSVPSNFPVFCLTFRHVFYLLTEMSINLATVFIFIQYIFFLFLFGFRLQNLHLWWKNWHKWFIKRISTADSKFKQAPYYR